MSFFINDLVQRARAEHAQKMQEQEMINPFVQQQGRRNDRAQNTANPFDRSAVNQQRNPFMQMQQSVMGNPNLSAGEQRSVMGQQNAGPTQQGRMQQVGTQQNAGTTQQMAGPTRQMDRGAMQQSVDPRMAAQSGMQQAVDPRMQTQTGMAAPQPQNDNPFMYNPNQQSPDLYQGQYWPGTGEMTLLRQGINPWGGQYSPEQQQWLQQVGPYASIPELNQNYDGRTELGRDFTAVNLADQAGGDVQQAFRDAWLGASNPQIAQNNYNVHHSSVSNPTGPGAPSFGPYQQGPAPTRGGTRPGGTNRFGG